MWCLLVHRERAEKSVTRARRTNGRAVQQFSHGPTVLAVELSPAS